MSGPLSEIMIGFCGGMALGLVCAMALWSSPFLYRVLDPFIVVLNGVPKIALVPIFYIWLGDTASIYAMAIAVSVFVTIIMLYTGFNAVDPDKIKLVRLFGASHRQVLWKIVLPASIPTMISTLKVNVGLALVGVIVGEFQAAKAGLGYLITYGSQIFQMNLVMTAIVVLAAISSVLSRLRLSRRFRPSVEMLSTPASIDTQPALPSRSSIDSFHRSMRVCTPKSTGRSTSASSSSLLGRKISSMK